MTELVLPPVASAEQTVATEEKPKKLSSSSASKSILVNLPLSASSSSSPTPTAPTSTSPAPTAPQKSNPGLLLLRDLGISIRGFSTQAPSLRASLHSSNKMIEIDYDMAGRESGPEVHEIDSLLFCVYEKLNSPTEFFKYLMNIYKVTRPKRPWIESVVRSINTQVMLLLEQEPAAAESLASYFESACSTLDVLHQGDELLTAQELQAWIQSFASRVDDPLQLGVFFRPTITLLVQKLASLQSTGYKVTPTLNALRIFFGHTHLRTVLIAHPYWNVALNGAAGPVKFDQTILGAILSISCAHQQDTGILGFSSTSVPQTELDKIRDGALAAMRSLSTIQSIMMSIVNELVSSADESHGDALLHWISAYVVNVPLKPHTTHYLLQWQGSTELQRRDGFFLNLALVMMRATQIAGDALGSDADRHNAIDLSFIENNFYGIAYPEKALLLDLDQFKDRFVERSDSQLAAYRTSKHAKYNALFLTSWLLLQMTYVPTTERLRAIRENVNHFGQQERAGNPNPQILAMTRQQLGIASSRLYSFVIAVSSLDSQIAVFLASTSDWLLDTLHIDLSDIDNPEAAALRESFDAEARLNGTKSESLLKELAAPDASLCQVPAFVMGVINTHYKWLLEEAPHIPFQNTFRHTDVYPARVLQLLTHLFTHSHLKNPHDSKGGLEVFGCLLAPLDPQAKTLRPLGPNEVRAHIERLTFPLIKFYINIEKMGPRAFYDKFPVRRLIGAVLRSADAQPLLMRASLDQELFMPFVMVLLNDSLYLLDESLSQLKTIHERHATISRLNAQPQRSDEDQQSLREAEQAMRQSAGQLRALSTFGNESMLLFEVLSSVSLLALMKDVKDSRASSSRLASSSSPSDAAAASNTTNASALHVPAILDSNILEQLSVMLNYFMDQFSTPAKRKKLQVSGIDLIDRNGTLAFNPRQIISCLVLTYLNMEQMCAILQSCSPNGPVARDTFRKAIVSESRSFGIAMFEEALQIVTGRDVLSMPTAGQALRLEWAGNQWSTSGPAAYNTALEAITRFTEYREHDIAFVIPRLKNFLQLLKESEEEVRSLDIPEDDIPDRYLDAIMATLMRDPVRLPSGHVVDRSTIVRQLAGHDKSDPFTRLPLTIDQVVPESELRAEIEEWMKEIRKPKSSQ